MTNFKTRQEKAEIDLDVLQFRFLPAQSIVSDSLTFLTTIIIIVLLVWIVPFPHVYLYLILTYSDFVKTANKIIFNRPEASKILQN